MQPRPLCKSCGKRPCAVNYHKADITHYRNRCSGCIRRNAKLRPQQPTWFIHGYRKKHQCEKCGFKAKYKEQLFVYYVDGNLNNFNPYNLKTVCSNCQIEISKEGLGWARGDIIPDY